MGCAGAVLGVSAPIFVAEIDKHDIRGTLSFFSQLLGLTGNWSVVGCVSAAFPFIFFVIFIFVPITPTFLSIKGKSESATKSVQWYCGNNCDIRMEMKELEKAVEETKSTEE
jgi:SP family facilitated glucose transporter-like MFS transporter 8